MNQMRKLCLFLVIAFLFAGCKKTIEKIQEDLVLKAMVDGYWSVTMFKQNGTNITTDFAPYKFKYYSNKTVDAINNGVVEITGNWDGNADNQTTWANFNNSSYPINLINGTWHIDNNSWTYVLASQATGGDTLIMRLDKQ